MFSRLGDGPLGAVFKRRNPFPNGGIVVVVV